MKIKITSVERYYKKNGFTFKVKMCINEFLVNENYSRKHLLFELSNKETFTGNMLDYGSHRYLEHHCKPIIEKTITDYENQIS